MNYEYNDGTTKYTSQWTRVKVNYLLIADTFESYPTTGGSYGGNYIWAGSAEITVTQGGSFGLFGPGSIFSNTSDLQSGACGYLQAAPSTSAAKFDTSCDLAAANDKIVPKYYIMGFQFAPGTYTLGAIAKIENYLSTASNTMDGRWGTTNITGFGPKVLYNSVDGGLKKLKVAFVLTTLKSKSTYPNTAQKFGYSGIYTEITVKNMYVPLKKGDIG